MRRPLVVLDTNAMISRVWGSPAMEPIAAAIRQGIIIPLVSPAILEEFRQVSASPKLSRGIDPADVRTFLRDLALFGRLIQPASIICSCEDPDDNMVLECACEGNADYIITGDKHLLKLHPFQGISILSPGDFTRTVLRQIVPS